MLFDENFCLPHSYVEKLGIEYGDPLLLLIHTKGRYIITSLLQRTSSAR